jgi:succinyl-CoA synthetase alpha subunit
MGHAGAFTLPGEPSAHDKVEALRAAGCAIVNHPSHFGPALSGLLDSSFTPRPSAGTAPSPTSVPTRGMHTYARRPATNMMKSFGQKQLKRNIHLKQSTAFDLLRQRGIPVVESQGEGSLASAPGGGRFLAVTLNRSTKSPCVLVSLSANAYSESEKKMMKKFDFDYFSGAENLDIDAIAAHLGLLESQQQNDLHEIVTGLVTIFKEKEAYLLETTLATRNNNSNSKRDSKPGLAIVSAKFGFDDAAYRSSKRQADIQALRDVSIENPFEVEAEKDGIVYIRLPDPEPNSHLYYTQTQSQEEKGEGQGKRAVANIGTLVNGAGLAMNTVDALADAGGSAANFLDTGGKATSETVKRSFELILTDERVKVCYRYSHNYSSFSGYTI